MKITDPEVIKNGEQDLIASVQENLDPEMIRDILKERLAMAALSPKGGRIVVHDNDIAFRLNFEVNLSGSLLFDRDGNLIGKETRTDTNQEKTAREAAGHEVPPKAEPEPVAPPLEKEPNEDGMEKNQEIAQGSHLPGSSDALMTDIPDDDLDSDYDPSVNLLQDQSNLETQIEDPAIKNEPESEKEIGNLDDDINDLLKESREFWSQKKKS